MKSERPDPDARLRNVLASVTPETSLQATRELVDIGFPPSVGFLLVCRVLEEKERASPSSRRESR